MSLFHQKPYIKVGKLRWPIPTFRDSIDGKCLWCLREMTNEERNTKHEGINARVCNKCAQGWANRIR